MEERDAERIKRMAVEAAERAAANAAKKKKAEERIAGKTSYCTSLQQHWLYVVVIAGWVGHNVPRRHL